MIQHQYIKKTTTTLSLTSDSSDRVVICVWESTEAMVELNV